jgi:hypothetical protein
MPEGLTGPPSVTLRPTKVGDPPNSVNHVRNVPLGGTICTTFGRAVPQCLRTLWWGVLGLNQRPLACRASALPLS